MTRPYSRAGEPVFPDRVAEVLDRIQLPLANIEMTLECYLLENGPRLDATTRMLLARLRDSIGRVAVTARRLEAEHAALTADPPDEEGRRVA